MDDTHELLLALPISMHYKIRRAAKRNNRSVRAEILTLLKVGLATVAAQQAQSRLATTPAAKKAP